VLCNFGEIVGHKLTSAALKEIAEDVADDGMNLHYSSLLDLFVNAEITMSCPSTVLFSTCTRAMNRCAFVEEFRCLAKPLSADWTNLFSPRLHIKLMEDEAISSDIDVSLLQVDRESFSHSV
jgi:hypothetical protein